MSATRLLGAVLPPLWLGVAVGCGPRSLDVDDHHAVFDDDCGAAEPSRVLSLTAEEFVPLHEGAVTRFGNRWLLAIATLDGALDGLPPGPERWVDRRVVSVDQCGSSPPQLVAEGIDTVIPSAEPGLPWLGCSSSSEAMVAIDPSRGSEPFALGTIVSCRVHPMTGSVWMRGRVEGADDRLVQLRSVEGLDTYSVANIQVSLATGDWTLAAQGDGVWYIDGDGVLLDASVLPDALPQVAQDVGSVLLSPDPRFLLWGSESDLITPGRWTIYDRQTLEQTAVEIAGSTDVTPWMSDDALVFRSRVRDDDRYDYALVQLPSLETTPARGRWSAFATNAAGDWALGADGGLDLLRTGESEPQRVYDGSITAVSIDGTYAWAWDYDDVEPGALDELREGFARLVRVPLAGGDPEVVVDRVFEPLGLDDGRWLAVQGWDEDGRGTLRMIDSVESTSVEIDDDVGVLLPRLGFAPDSFPEDALPGDASFLYSVHDDGERSGLWRAGLAPRHVDEP